MKREVELSNILDKDGNVYDFATEKQKRLAPATGGGGGDEDWLKNLPKGSVFIARQRVPKGQIRPWLGTLYLVAEMHENSAILKCMTPEDRTLKLPVHILDFSRQNEYIETIAILEYEDAPMEEEQDNGKEG